MQQHARGEHRPSPGARPSYIRASERTVSTQAAAAESGPWRQPFLAEYAQYLGQDSLCSAQKSALASNIYLNAVDHCGRCTRYVGLGFCGRWILAGDWILRLSRGHV